MQKSKLEEVAVEKLKGLKSEISRHDRAVVLGVLLGLLPIFPTAIFGVIIGLGNLRLIKAGNLDEFELSLVNKGLFIGVINTIISMVILYYIASVIADIGWNGLIQTVIDGLYSFLNELSQLVHKSPAKVFV